MFARSHRFHGYGALKAVYARGKSARGSAISLKYLQRDGDKPYRVAVVVSRKVSKSAVVRNRIRRRVYAQVREVSAALPTGLDLVFTVYSDQVAAMESDKLATALRDLLQKAR
jgi:ribonuclease P protein component